MNDGKLILLMAFLAATGEAAAQEYYRGVVVASEFRCSPYDRSDYPYPQSVEASVIAEIGHVYSPYTGQCFASARETDIEHIVALSEAHDSGLCAASAARKAQFARDLLNLTLASPSLNRYEKGAKDVAGWLPRLNACWFAARTLEVRRKYGLSIDAQELDAVERTLAQCSSTEMVVLECGSLEAKLSSVRTPEEPSGNTVNALQRWDDNGNGRITCAEARRHGIAPVPRTHPAYQFGNYVRKCRKSLAADFGTIL